MIRRNVRHIICAARHSYRGLRAAFLGERAFRIETFLTIFVLPLAFYIGHSVSEYIFLLGSWFFVLLMELLNTAIETIIDRIGLEHHPASGKAKDIGSALVFISAIQGLLVWGIIFIFSFFKATP
jgi:diacylglycerol kinase (ATP)